ncbi:MAG: PAS domain S-box protein [Candidatus Latescibacteria bacterium]|nr:PAS domain S-box protein [Candidatus Latescibacterota bacterium]NIM22565.1 PAS domain S-box protein [Candidatus Latescibacterota bacterium]NIM64854.1 PAS domain S-box protein [Candidatus Latescibacterota bacterium]NIO01369.1 PAS domain S-box protein [Candidatus Latescibacterota bacterium]NIO27879.1 PAS domain S-box protein [Candidatus Latescibacterota bacterium]
MNIIKHLDDMWQSNFSHPRKMCEKEQAFRDEIIYLNKVGMRLAGVLAVFGPTFSIAVTNLILKHQFSFFPVEPTRGMPVWVVWDDLVIVVLGLFCIGISFTHIGQRMGRLIVALVMVVMLFAMITGGTTSDFQMEAEDYILTVTMLMMIAVGTMPYRPIQMFGLGIVLTITYYLSITFFPQLYGDHLPPPPPQYMVYLLMVTFFAMLISALIYSNRYKQFGARKNAEYLRKQALESEQKYRSLFENSSDGIFAFDNNTKLFRLVNPEITGILGYTEEELLRMRFTEVIHPDDLERVVGYHLARIKGDPAPNHYRLKLKHRHTEEPVICDLTVHRIEDPDLTMGAIRDITEHVKLEAEIEQLARFPETNPFPVLRFDYEGNVLYMNPAAKDIPRWHGSPDKSITDLMPDDFVLKIQGLIDRDQTIPYERVELFDRTFAVTYKPLKESRQIFIWMVDVTDLVYAEHRIRIYAAELEATNRELRDAQEQLVQSEKMAALGNLVAGVAHEINSPLGSIRANADVSSRALSMLRASINPGNLSESFARNPKIQQAMDVLTESTATTRVATGRIVEIVKSLRNFARLDEAERKRADLHEGINSTLTLLQHELKQRVKVAKHYGNLPQIECFPHQLNQVFMNVLMNASQAIGAEGTITITTKREGDWVVLTLSDTGRGIPAEDLDRIFDPGFTTKGVGVGTGLGLSISYRIVQDHGGSIRASSEIGKGTTFTIKLPIR